MSPFLWNEPVAELGDTSLQAASSVTGLQEDVQLPQGGKHNIHLTVSVIHLSMPPTSMTGRQGQVSELTVPRWASPQPFLTDLGSENEDAWHATSFPCYFLYAHFPFGTISTENNFSLSFHSILSVTHIYNTLLVYLPLLI